MAGEATAFPVAWRAARPGTRRSRSASARRSARRRARRGRACCWRPTINMLRHPRWGRAQETYGEDTLHLGRMGVGVHPRRAAARRSPARSTSRSTASRTRARSSTCSVDERTLREVYLPHFREAVQRGHVGSVMSAYNKVNGQYCAENVHLLRDILKERLGLPGLRRVGLVRRHAQHRPVGDRRARHRDAGAGVLRRSRSVAAVDGGGACRRP